MARMSIATIDKPEFINIKPCNPLISECEIKVMYVGENRNKSVITKEVAKEMANTLPGCPIVGYFKKDKQDFGDHGERVVIDDTGLHFECLTRPYGFVAPDAKVWFQKFEDYDDFGNSVVREYMMTTGFLWTGQYPECQSAVDEGKPHSMELDDETLNGQWTKNYKTGMDFFIINDAIFSKLCILGDDVEPCFEGSSVTAPEISASFTKVDDKFTSTLFTMMQELKDALKGEQKMFDVDKEVQTSFASDKKEEEKEEKVQDAPSKEEGEKEDKKSEAPAKEDEEDKKKKFAKEDDEEEKKEDSAETPSKDEEEKEDDDKKKKFAKEEDEEKEENVDKDNKSSEDKKEEDEEEKKKYSLLEEEYESLKTQYSALQSQYNELLAFKNQIEDEKKDALINSFYMLSEEDKAEVIENKAKYSLDDIEAKLSVICVRKKVNFDLDETSEIEDKEESPVTTFSLNDQASAVPAWVSALRNTKNGKNN